MKEPEDVGNHFVLSPVTGSEELGIPEFEPECQGNTSSGGVKIPMAIPNKITCSSHGTPIWGFPD